MHHTLPGVSHFPGQSRGLRVRQESGGYDPLADRPDFPSPSPTLTSRRMVEPLTSHAPVPHHPSLTHTRHAHTRQTRRSALKRKENGKEETGGRRSTRHPHARYNAKSRDPLTTFD